jgi:molybdopterin-guanine dinucleotide biosynthesis protein A
MFSAAILIGGKATRFEGRDKSSLIVEGQTILSRQLAAVSGVASDVMLVGPSTPPSEVAGSLGAGGSPRYVADIVPGCGPLSGIHAALSAARGDATLILACDMPFVSTPLLRHLVSLADQADIVVPQTERGYHPLCAVYSRACVEPAARRLARGDFTLAALVDEMRVRVVTADALEAFGDPDRLLANVNTSIEYRAIEANGMQS